MITLHTTRSCIVAFLVLGIFGFASTSGCDDSDFRLGKEADSDSTEEDTGRRDLSNLFKDTEEEQDTTQADTPVDLEDSPHITIISHDVSDIPEDDVAEDTNTTPDDTTPPQDTQMADTADTSPPPDTTLQDTTPPQDTNVGFDTAPPPTVSPGSYIYERLPVGGLDRAIAVDFHPDSSYFVVLESFDEVHIYDVASKTATRFNLKPTGANFYFESVDFDPSGKFALISGYHTNSGGDTGVIYKLDDAGWRNYTTGAPIDTVFTQVSGVPVSDAVAGVAWPWDGGIPMVLVRLDPPGSGYVMRLYRYDTAAGTFTSVVDTVDMTPKTFTSAGCTDLVWVKNEFDGPGVLVTCGINGFSALYWTEIGGVAELRNARDMGNSNLGNTHYLSAYPGGEYALIVSWSGRSVYRFENGALNAYGDAARFSTLGIWNVRFQQNGARALVTGRTSVQGTGTVIEYRHDLYDCPSPFSNCDLTHVPIPDFTASATSDYNATSNTYLNASAWRPGCDGGIIVGGDSSRGYVISFQVQGGTACW